MATYIKTMKDPADNIIAPRTVAEAVYMGDGVTQLDDKIVEIETQKASTGKAIAMAIVFG